MKLYQFIRRLEAIKQQHGDDVPVFVYNEYATKPIEAFITFVGEPKEFEIAREPYVEIHP